MNAMTYLLQTRTEFNRRSGNSQNTSDFLIRLYHVIMLFVYSDMRNDQMKYR